MPHLWHFLEASPGLNLIGDALTLVADAIVLGLRVRRQLRQDAEALDSACDLGSMLAGSASGEQIRHRARRTKDYVPQDSSEGTSQGI